MLRKPNEVMIGNKTLKELLSDIYPNLSHLDLSNIDFSNTNLARADLSGSNLSDSIFNNTNLCKANLSCAILRYAKFINAKCENLMCGEADLSYVHISHSDFTHAGLECSNFMNATIKKSKFHNAYLGYANFSNSNITNTNFRYADLCNTNFNGTYFFNDIIIGAMLDRVNLTGCDLSRANLIGRFMEYRKGKVLTEPIIGYKKCLTDDDQNDTIVTLEIPRGAIVFSINGDKCRTNRAKVIDIDNGYKRAYASHEYFSYYIGDEINIYDFDLQYNNECSTGIHFFMTREEAEDY